MFKELQSTIFSFHSYNSNDQTVAYYVACGHDKACCTICSPGRIHLKHLTLHCLRNVKSIKLPCEQPHRSHRMFDLA